MKRENEEFLNYDDGRMYLDDEPFTGIGFFLDDEGQLETETTYREGIQMGLRRAWFETGQLQHEYMMFRGVLHGKKREWHFNGQLSEEGDCEFGYVLRRKRWNEDGELIEDFEVDANDPIYEQVKLDRETYKEELEEEAMRSTQEE